MIVVCGLGVVDVRDWRGKDDDGVAAGAWELESALPWPKTSTTKVSSVREWPWHLSSACVLRKDQGRAKRCGDGTQQQMVLQRKPPQNPTESTTPDAPPNARAATEETLNTLMLSRS